MPDHREFITEVYRAFNARDIDTALAAMTPDVDWPNGMEGGYVRGHDAVRAYWTRQWGMIDPHVEPVGISSGEAGRVVVDVHSVVRDLSGQILKDTMVQHIYRIENGLIGSMEIVAGRDDG